MSQGKAIEDFFLNGRLYTMQYEVSSWDEKIISLCLQNMETYGHYSATALKGQCYKNDAEMMFQLQNVVSFNFAIIYKLKKSECLAMIERKIMVTRDENLSIPASMKNVKTRRNDVTFGAWILLVMLRLVGTLRILNVF